MAAFPRSLLGLGFFLVFISLPAFAHKPVSIGGTFSSMDQALHIENIDVSQVVYSPLSEDYPQLWLTFEATSGTILDVSLGLPVLDRLADYRPNLAVIGPGLPDVDLPFETPLGGGGIVFESAANDNPRFFHEHVTGTKSWILIDESVILPAAGNYYVVAWPSGDQIDKLWVAIGKREQFGVRDLLSFPAIIRDVRSFHEVSNEPHWSRTAGMIVFAALSVGVISWVVFGSW